ncbi:LADA_0B03664g1_1 [Lachancea dasiensis]|uniref:LADA_0B03664g1_1 n=1 Tax=Lachancea dasiensis TaxID=1072105 RepID=A0A1G4IT93_9SACH|nr:LADA_0B03664g1_1 [Lachancea dasiensis]
MFNMFGCQIREPSIHSGFEKAAANSSRTIEDSLKELETFFSCNKVDIRKTDADVSPSGGSTSNTQFNHNNLDTTYCELPLNSRESDQTDATNVIWPHSVSLVPRPQNIRVADGSRYFVIKSSRAEHINISMINGVWSSTELGNRRLSQAFRTRPIGARIFLFFSVNGSGCFCGLAEMVGDLRESDVDLWTEKKRFKRVFSVDWLIQQELPNSKVRHLRNSLNEMKSVTHSRDTQEVPMEIGQPIVQIFEDFVKLTSVCQYKGVGN